MRIDKSHDACGRGCPMLMIELNKTINVMTGGQVLEFLCNDQMSFHDIPLWCERTGNRMLACTREEGIFRYLIEKGEGRPVKKRRRDFSRY